MQFLIKAGCKRCGPNYCLQHTAAWQDGYFYPNNNLNFVASPTAPHWTSIQHHSLLILEYLMIKTAFCFQSQSPPFVFSIHNKWKELIPFLARSCCQSTVDRESALRQLRRVLHLSPTGTTASVHNGRIRWLISVKRSASPPMVPSPRQDYILYTETSIS